MIKIYVESKTYLNLNDATKAHEFLKHSSEIFTGD